MVVGGRGMLSVAELGYVKLVWGLPTHTPSPLETHFRDEAKTKAEYCDYGEGS